MKVINVAIIVFLFVSPVLAAGSMSSMEWIQIGNPLVPRRSTGMCYNPDTGTVFLYGGTYPNGYYTDTWEWTNGKWEQIPSAQTPNFRGLGHLVYSTGENTMLLFGNDITSNRLQIWEWMDHQWVFTNESDQVPRAWYFYGYAYDESIERLVLTGGYSEGSRVEDVWEWDGTAWHHIPQSSPWPPLRLGALSPALTYNPDFERVVLLTSYNGQLELWYWDGVIWEKQEFGPPRPPNTSSTTIAYDPDRNVVVMYGAYNRNDTWEWDGVQWHEMNPPNQPESQTSHSLIWDGHSRRIMLFGGMRGSSSLGNTCFYDGSDWVCHPPDPFYPRPASGHAMAYNPNEQKTILFHGGSTYEWHNHEWRHIDTPEDPGQWSNTCLAFMSSLDGIVLYSGSNYYWGETNYQTWLYRNQTWIQLDPPVYPGPQSGVSMTYDSFRDRIVLFGGNERVQLSPDYWEVYYYDETWEFDGHSWYQVFTAHAPSPRTSSHITFDSCRGVTVLYGGSDRYQKYDDSWEYDGMNWTRIQPASQRPSPRGAAAFSYDSHRCRVVMHGGIATYQPGFNETWEWDGYDWYLIEPTGGRTGPRVSAAMVYDADQRQSIMFGGGKEGYTVETLAYQHSNPDMCDQMGVTLDLSKTLFRPGDIFSCHVTVCNNTGEPLHGYPLLALLDVYGSLYWAPSFTQDFDSFLDRHPSFPEGETIVEVLPAFTWPHNVGSADGIRLYAAVTDPESRILIGHWDMAEFGWE
jgi:hypothetical protein